MDRISHSTSEEDSPFVEPEYRIGKGDETYFLEVAAGGPPGEAKTPTLDASLRAGLEKDLGKNFFYQIGGELKPRFNTVYGDSYVQDPLRSIDVSLVKARVGWRGVGDDRFTALAPFLQAGHVIRFDTRADAGQIADPAVFTFGGGVDWYASGPIAVFSQLDVTTEGDSATFMTGVRLYAE